MSSADETAPLKKHRETDKNTAQGLTQCQIKFHYGMNAINHYSDLIYIHEANMNKLFQ